MNELAFESGYIIVALYSAGLATRPSIFAAPKRRMKSAGIGGIVVATRRSLIRPLRLVYPLFHARHDGHFRSEAFILVQTLVALGISDVVWCRSRELSITKLGKLSLSVPPAIFRNANATRHELTSRRHRN